MGQCRLQQRPRVEYDGVSFASTLGEHVVSGFNDSAGVCDTRRCSR
jgi:hypothetical protein